MVAFKKIGLNDLSRIQAIAYNTWPKTFRQIISEEQINYMLQEIYNDESLKNQILQKGHNFILAEKDRRSLGFTSYQVNYNSEPQLMIHKLYILPEAQGLGIGTKFLNLLSEIALLNNNSKLRLKVYFENAKAIGFYEKSGFQKTGTEITVMGKAYAILDDVMEKKLPLPGL